MKIVLQPGEEIEIEFADADGGIVVGFDHKRIRAKAYMADIHGRSGVIYDEIFGEKVAAVGDIVKVDGDKAAVFFTEALDQPTGVFEAEVKKIVMNDGGDEISHYEVWKGYDRFNIGPEYIIWPCDEKVEVQSDE